jgi:hypothetical protein
MSDDFDRVENRREQNRAWHWKRRAAGLCHSCGQPREPGNEAWTCRRPLCRAKRNADRRTSRNGDSR